MEEDAEVVMAAEVEAVAIIVSEAEVEPPRLVREE